MKENNPAFAALLELQGNFEFLMVAKSAIEQVSSWAYVGTFASGTPWANIFLFSLKGVIPSTESGLDLAQTL